MGVGEFVMNSVIPDIYKGWTVSVTAEKKGVPISASISPTHLVTRL